MLSILKSISALTRRKAKDGRRDGREDGRGLRSFFHRPGRTMLGIDIGTSTLKMVELAPGAQKAELRNYGEVKTRDYLATIKEALQKPLRERPDLGLGEARSAAASVSPDEQIGDLLDGLLEKANVDTRQAVLSIPVFASFSTTLDFPVGMSESELSEAVPYEAKSHVPLPLSEVELDWMALPWSRPEAAPTREVLIVAVPKEMFERYRRIAERASIEPVAFEVETFSLARALGRKETSAVVVDIGTSITSFTIVEQGFVRLSHSVEVAGGEFSRMVAQGLRIGLDRAEELKKREGIVERNSVGVRSVLTPFIDRLAGEAERFLALYERRAPRKIEKIIFSGGSSQLPGLKEYVSAKLRRTAVSGDALAGLVYPPELTQIAAELNATFAVATGLAMRELL